MSLRENSSLLGISVDENLGRTFKRTKKKEEKKKEMCYLVYQKITVQIAEKNKYICINQ